jgi:hypothetical protein
LEDELLERAEFTVQPESEDTIQGIKKQNRALYAVSTLFLAGCTNED